ncbi:MAG TPA: M20/M25/M40 family metallo-hydrolase [Gemmatimonadales bacterium]|jgi:acetylornithine deacetylase
MLPPTDPVVLTRALLAVPSPTNHEGPVTAFLAEYLRRRDWQVTLQPVTEGRHNLYALASDPVVVLSTHLDTVPPELAWREDDTTIYGRGACDAKGIAAAMIAAAETLRAEGELRVGLLFVVGEEDGSDGARTAADFASKGHYLINGEPTENSLVTAQKGTMKVQLRVTGRAAHSGYPHLGDSAIDRLLDALQRIRAIPLPADPLLGASTLNIGVIHAGEAPNVVAPWATAELLFRTVGDTTATVAAVRDAAGEGVEVLLTGGIPPATAPALAGWRTSIAAFASDLAYHGSWGTCYQLGPGSIHVAHTEHEQINKDELREGVVLYVRLARQLLAEHDRSTR